MNSASRFLGVVCVIIVSSSLAAQELEPRSYSNTPVGLRFIVLAAGYSSGDLVFDPTLPVEDANASVRAAVLGYVNTINLFGRTGKISVVLPVVDGRATGLLNGEPAERNVSGLGDARLGVTMLFFGAPARSAPEFLKANRSSTVAGVSLYVGVPVGQYDDDRIINIGSNRFSVKPEIGITHNFGKWTFEGAAGAVFFQDNDDWLETSTRTQDPIYSVQAHVVRDIRPRLWMAFDMTYYWGGQAKVDGVASGLELGNTRFGLTLSLPVAKTQSLKFTASSGVWTRTGTDFDSYGIAWQWAIPPKL